MTAITPEVRNSSTSTTQRSMVVRPGVQDDVPWMLYELRAFARFFGTKRSLFPDDEQEAAERLRDLICYHVVLVAEHKLFSARMGIDPSAVYPAGFLIASLGPHPFNEKIMTLTELFWWVLPGSRGSRAGALLFAEFMRFGHEHADWIIMSLEEKSPVNPETLERRGFRLHERSYLLEVER